MILLKFIKLTNYWLLRNPEMHYRPYISLPLYPILSKIYPTTQPTSLNSILISSHRHCGLPEGLFPLRFSTKYLYAFLDFSMRSTCPDYLGRLDLRLLIKLGEEYNACSSALCNFLHSLVISSLILEHL